MDGEAWASTVSGASHPLARARIRIREPAGTGSAPCRRPGLRCLWATCGHSSTLLTPKSRRLPPRRGLLSAGRPCAVRRAPRSRGLRAWLPGGRVGGLRLLLRILAGLTQNKVVQDVRRLGQTERALTCSSQLRRTNLAERDRRAGGLGLPDPPLRVPSACLPTRRGTCSEPLLESVDEATWPGYVRQEHAEARWGTKPSRHVAVPCWATAAPRLGAEERREPALAVDLQSSGGMSYDLRARPSPEKGTHTASDHHYSPRSNIISRLQIKRQSGIHKAMGPPMTTAGTGMESRSPHSSTAWLQSNTAGLTGVLTNADESAVPNHVEGQGYRGLEGRHNAVVALPAEQIERLSRSSTSSAPKP